MEKHQYGFAIMNLRTGNIKRKSFWATGNTEEECKKNARQMAENYARSEAEKYYQKAQAKNRSPYALNRSSYEFQVVGCSLWK